MAYNKNMSYYTPYRRDVDDIEYRRTHRTSNTSKIVGLIIWFTLIAIFT